MDAHTTSWQLINSWTWCECMRRTWINWNACHSVHWSSCVQTSQRADVIEAGLEEAGRQPYCREVPQPSTHAWASGILCSTRRPLPLRIWRCCCSLVSPNIWRRQFAFPHGQVYAISLDFDCMLFNKSLPWRSILCSRPSRQNCIRVGTGSITCKQKRHGIAVETKGHPCNRCHSLSESSNVFTKTRMSPHFLI